MKMKGMNLTKVQVAHRQLGTGLKLFLSNHDPVSVHALACAGGGIAEHLTRKRGEQPFSSHALATFPDLDAKKIRRLRNQFWNAFRHASTQKGEERDDRKLLKRFNDLQNDHALFIGWYASVSDLVLCALSRKAQSRLWQNAYWGNFFEVARLSRKKQKQALRNVIARYRKNADVMNDEKTERAPLIALA
jgi:hypothetical protein